jgi:hypothetical protein
MRARGVFAIVLLAAHAATAPSARAAVQPDPGNAAAWASGLALLAEPPGGLALFDQPARIAAAAPARFALGLARARPFGFDALARHRLAGSARRGAFAAALGVETSGPREARRTRLGLALAWTRPPRAPEAASARAGGLALGAAWHEARRVTPRGTAGSGALDAGVVIERGRLAASLALRSLASGGAPIARADPDWTAEARLAAAPARLHVALTHDLGGTRLGGGMSFDAGPVTVRAGAWGAPWSAGVGLSLGRGGAALAFARAQHPALGASDAWTGGAAW